MATLCDAERRTKREGVQGSARGSGDAGCAASDALRRQQWGSLQADRREQSGALSQNRDSSADPWRALSPEDDMGGVRVRGTGEVGGGGAGEMRMAAGEQLPRRLLGLEALGVSPIGEDLPDRGNAGGEHRQGRGRETGSADQDGIAQVRNQCFDIYQV
jgi:hypothetical protein